MDRPGHGRLPAEEDASGGVKSYSLIGSRGTFLIRGGNHWLARDVQVWASRLVAPNSAT